MVSVLLEPLAHLHTVEEAPFLSLSKISPLRVSPKKAKAINVQSHTLGIEIIETSSPVTASCTNYYLTTQLFYIFGHILRLWWIYHFPLTSQSINIYCSDSFCDFYPSFSETSKPTQELVCSIYLFIYFFQFWLELAYCTSWGIYCQGIEILIVSSTVTNIFFPLKSIVVGIHSLYFSQHCFTKLTRIAH